MANFRILLVDDEERFVLNLARLLATRGFEVITAFGGREALERLSSRDHRVDVVVLDVRMPGMDGLETLQQIKARQPEIEVIMLTGQASLEDGIQAVRQGAFDYLQKPCDIEDLKTKIMSARSVERIKRHPVLWPRSMAGEVLLTGFVPLLPEDTLERALTIFNLYRNGEGARILFVVDRHGSVQGVVGRRDLLAAVENERGPGEINWEWIQKHPQGLEKIPVQRAMRREAASVSPQTSLVETARLMLSHRYDSLPVVSEGAVLGIIRLRDVLRHMEAADGGDTAARR